MKYFFRKYDFNLAKDRAKMLWTDRDMAFVCSISVILGYLIGKII